MEPAAAFGPRLRQERERRQISLTSIAENTKISRSLLEALERDDVSRWPGGIFRRSFLRSYATAIGLDADEIVREFAERFPDPEARREPAPAPVPGATPRLTLADSNRVDLVFRVSIPRSVVSWLDWAFRRTHGRSA